MNCMFVVHCQVHMARKKKEKKMMCKTSVKQNEENGWGDTDKRGKSL